MSRDSDALFEARARTVLPECDPPGHWHEARHQAGLENTLICARTASPYLATLLEKWPCVAEDLKYMAPEAVYTQLVQNLAAPDLAQARRCARQAKQKLHLLLSLCDLAGIWDEMTVCDYLSAFADQVMQLFITHLADEAGFESRPDNPVPGLFVLALGKYGAGELNYSSDIDLVVMYDPDRLDIPNPERSEKILIRFVKRLMRSFDEVTPDGYVFRTDMRLRPDPRATTIAVSTRSAERYYEALGQNWERAAMIKARCVGGDQQAGQHFIEAVLGPFIWRKSLDYHAIDDIHSIKRQIQSQAGAEDYLTPGHDVKLGLGGIREIEFFVQVQQLILGGRFENLRCMKTLDALQALADAGFVAQHDASCLQTAYRLLRRVEHRLQMYRDEQTHIWPQQKVARQNIAALCGYVCPSQIEEKLQDVFSGVHEIYAALFAGEEELSAELGSLVFTGLAPEPQTLATLEKYGFERCAEVWQHMAEWLGGRLPATRSARARELLTRLAPRLIEACGQTGAADTAFFGFGAFIAGLGGGVSVFSLLLRKPQVLSRLCQMLAVVPQLAGRIARMPAVLDVLADPDFTPDVSGNPTISYLPLVQGVVDFETGMNVVRKAQREDQFAFISAFLAGHIESDAAGETLSDMAEASIAAMLELARRYVEEKTGPLAGEFAVLGLGKLGGREMRLNSDVDIMLVYQAPQKGREKAFSQLTRRLVTALSCQTAEGRLYEVDMALRPSGRAGPLAVSVSAFEKYYRNSAWTWEFMALSRGRTIAGSSPGFLQHLEHLRETLLKNKDYGGGLRTDIVDMHDRLRREKPDMGVWDIKNTPGGLRDIEFIAQYLMLRDKPEDIPRATRAMIECAKDLASLSVPQALSLQEALCLYTDIGHVMAIAGETPRPGKQLHPATRHLLLQRTGRSDFSVLSKDLHRIQAHVREIFSAVFGVDE